MKTSQYPGQEYKTDIKVTYDKGMWSISQEVTHRRSKDLVEWEENAIGMLNTGADLETTMMESMYNLDEYLAQIGYDLFTLVDNPPTFEGELM